MFKKTIFTIALVMGIYSLVIGSDHQTLTINPATDNLIIKVAGNVTNTRGNSGLYIFSVTGNRYFFICQSDVNYQAISAFVIDKFSTSSTFVLTAWQLTEGDMPGFGLQPNDNVNYWFIAGVKQRY